jgi:hypothetical protein
MQTYYCIFWNLALIFVRISISYACWIHNLCARAHEHSLWGFRKHNTDRWLQEAQGKPVLL